MFLTKVSIVTKYCSANTGINVHLYLHVEVENSNMNT